MGEKKKYLLDDERTGRADDDVNKIEVAIPDLFNPEVIEVVAKLRGEGRHGLYVLNQGRLVQRPELRESHGRRKVGLWGLRRKVGLWGLRRKVVEVFEAGRRSVSRQEENVVTGEGGQGLSPLWRNRKISGGGTLNLALRTSPKGGP